MDTIGHDPYAISYQPLAMFTDLRHAVRLFLNAPGFTLLVVVVLAVGIGATTSIFSVVDGVLLKPLPFPDADRVIAIQSVTQADNDGSASVPDITDFQAAGAVQDVVGYTGGTAILTGRGEATTLLTSCVTGDLMATLRAPLLRGRPLTAADVRAGAAPTAIISERLWTERFARDPSVVGGTAAIEGEAFTIVGVGPDSLGFPMRARVGELSLT